ncbi:hypothetical protein GDO86_012648 [Hymenochirus boettgeri]|uniref:G-protein coupled receptors family 1 profile domain-containing protein n=1 Tax=Hymenochirus boettgeri TaxID=247094 RepID=A0A8T2IN12_9PIPI|nr:hypothetical protein GDO86_012648 [Hymenochirus boettgeri]
MSGTRNSTNSSEECYLKADFQYGFFTVLYSIVFILGLPGNVMSLYYLSRRDQRSRSSNIYFLNLSTADLVFICLLPVRIYYHNTGNNWVFGDVACRITGTLFYANIYVSIGFFSCICLDRYLAVLHPFKYRRMKSSSYPLILTVSIWLLCGAVILPLMFGGPLNNVSEHRNRTFCFEEFSPGMWKGRLVPYNVCALIFGFFVPFCVVAILIPVMARNVCRFRTSIHRRVALRIFGFIMAVSLICFLPYNITHLFHLLMRLGFIQQCSSRRLIYQLRRITLALVSVNSCVNPVLYFIPSISRSFLLTGSHRAKPVYTICSNNPEQNQQSISLPCFVMSHQQEPSMVKRVAKAEWTAL